MFRHLGQDAQGAGIQWILTKGRLRPGPNLGIVCLTEIIGSAARLSGIPIFSGTFSFRLGVEFFDALDPLGVGTFATGVL